MAKLAEVGSVEAVGSNTQMNRGVHGILADFVGSGNLSIHDDNYF
jgi:hypothetical protein